MRQGEAELLEVKRIGGACSCADESLAAKLGGLATPEHLAAMKSTDLQLFDFRFGVRFLDISSLGGFLGASKHLRQL